MKKVLMMLFIGIIVSSCQNEEEKFALEGSYKLHPTATLGKVRMYTSKGEVTDEAMIRKFLSRVSRIYRMNQMIIRTSFLLRLSHVLSVMKIIWT
jgi:hypothetical protein